MLPFIGADASGAREKTREGNQRNVEGERERDKK